MLFENYIGLDDLLHGKQACNKDDFCRLIKDIKFNYAAENQEFLAKLSLAKPATSAGVLLFNDPCGLIKL